jgi:hypothetical protein
MRSTRRFHSRVLASSGAAIIGAALILATAAPVTAQVDTASAVRGSVKECLTIAFGTDDTGPGASAATTNEVWKCQVESDDERLNGEIDLLYNIAGWSDVGAIQWGYARISNDEGTWNGTWSSTVQEGGEQVILGWYEGTGAYEGWSYTETQQGEYQQSRETFGIVYPGTPPPTVVIVPFPDPDVEAAE